MDSIFNEFVMPFSTKHADAVGGSVISYYRAGAIELSNVGEVYISKIECGQIRAWKKHTSLVSALSVVVGSVEVTYCSDRGDYRSYILSSRIHQGLLVRPGLWFGIRALGGGSNLLLNVASEVYSPHEVLRRPIDYFDFYKDEL